MFKAFIFPSPNEVLLIIDRKGRRIVRNRREPNWPLREVHRVPLNVIEIEVDTNDVETKDPKPEEHKVGPKLHIVGIAQVKVGDTDEEIFAAAERFFTRTERGGNFLELMKQIVDDMMPAFQRNVAGTMTPEEIVSNGVEFAKRVCERAKTELASMGVQLTYQLKDVGDAPGFTYLKDLATMRGEEARKGAELAKIEADKMIEINKVEKDRDIQKAQIDAALDVSEASFKQQQRAGKIEQDLLDLVASVSEKKARVEEALGEIEITKAEYRAWIKREETKADADAIGYMLQVQNDYLFLAVIDKLIEGNVIQDSVKAKGEFLRNLRSVMVTGGKDEGSVLQGLMNIYPQASMLKEIIGEIMGVASILEGASAITPATEEETKKLGEGENTKRVNGEGDQAKI